MTCLDSKKWQKYCNDCLVIDSLIWFYTGYFYPWSPKDLTRAKAIAQYNLATAHAIRGEYDKAGQNLGEVGQVFRKSICTVWIQNQLNKLRNSFFTL